MYSYIIIHSSINRHLDYSLSWLSIMNMWYRCLFEAIFLSLDAYAVIAGSSLNFIYCMSMAPHADWHYGCTNLRSLQHCERCFFSPVFPMFPVFSPFDKNHVILMSVRCYLIEFYLHPQVISDLKHFSHTFFYIFFEECLCRLLRVFVVKLHGFFVYLGC